VSEIPDFTKWMRGAGFDLEFKKLDIRTIFADVFDKYDLDE
jgi:hypothetical protein